MFFDTAQTLRQWETDENNFLRNRIRVLASGVMDYLGSELAGYHAGSPDDQVPVFVPMEAINDPRTQRSLEGMPVVADSHTWIEPDGDRSAEVGSVAGSARLDGPYLECDIIVRDAETIEKIKSGALCDVSAGYSCVYKPVKGVYDGHSYDYVQESLHFNHICILPPDKGRGGRNVRVLNHKAETQQMEFTRVQIGENGPTVRVANEDITSFNSAIDGLKKARTQNEAMSAQQIEATLAELETVKGQMEELQGKKSELEGSLQTLKDQLEAAMSPEAIEEAANEMVEEREEAADMMVSNGAYSDKEQAMNEAKGLRGHALRLHAVNKARVANSKPALDGDDAANEGFVMGVFSALKDSPAKITRTAPGAAKVVNAGTTKTCTENADPFGFAAHNKLKGA